jgi:hypothetical protein
LDFVSFSSVEDSDLNGRQRRYDAPCPGRESDFVLSLERKMPPAKRHGANLEKGKSFCGSWQRL